MIPVDASSDASADKVHIEATRVDPRSALESSDVSVQTVESADELASVIIAHPKLHALVGALCFVFHLSNSQFSFHHVRLPVRIPSRRLCLTAGTYSTSGDERVTLFDAGSTDS